MCPQFGVYDFGVYKNVFYMGNGLYTIWVVLAFVIGVQKCVFCVGFCVYTKIWCQILQFVGVYAKLLVFIVA